MPQPPIGTFYNARYYDAAIGRFISQDTIVPDIGNQGFNRYMYVGGNPIMYSDPSGHIPFLVGLLIVMAIGGTVGTVTHAIQNNGCTFQDCLGAFLKGAVISGLLYVATAGIGTAFGLEGMFGTTVTQTEWVEYAWGFYKEIPVGTYTIMNSSILANAGISGTIGGVGSGLYAQSSGPVSSASSPAVHVTQNVAQEQYDPIDEFNKIAGNLISYANNYENMNESDIDVIQNKLNRLKEIASNYNEKIPIYNISFKELVTRVVDGDPRFPVNSPVSIINMFKSLLVGRGDSINVAYNRGDTADYIIGRLRFLQENTKYLR